jgi:hypothetical protein
MGVGGNRVLSYLEVEPVRAGQWKFVELVRARILNIFEEGLSHHTHRNFVSNRDNLSIFFNDSIIFFECGLTTPIGTLFPIETALFVFSRFRDNLYFYSFGGLSHHTHRNFVSNRDNPLFYLLHINSKFRVAQLFANSRFAPLARNLFGLISFAENGVNHE